MSTPGWPDSPRFLGSPVRSKWERGWPFGSLTCSPEWLDVRGVFFRARVERADIRAVDVEVVRIPGFWTTVLWLDGVEPRLGFVPLRPKAAVRELERQGWPVVRTR